ncbi:GNAT family N-acetyltransferase [Streptomyces lydicamycinicus]
MASAQPKDRSGEPTSGIAPERSVGTEEPSQVSERQGRTLITISNRAPSDWNPTNMALGGVAVGNLSTQHATGWISYWTTSAARGKGVATHGCRALANWCFADLQLFRLELGHRTNNPASCRVAQAAGFAPEGLQRQKLAYDGIRYDVETHARLATDSQPR